MTLLILYLIIGVIISHFTYMNANHIERHWAIYPVITFGWIFFVFWALVDAVRGK
jgi:hypothetical protein